ncbi:EAL domain-containing protein [Alteromonas sediminis]|uniref:EAL domain-containing protein n=1 Tax=Alteromonas sediminis TaxID=2259342 RepID=A0A3N5ZDL3_9ALTE|nr:EAL domain-containing protein [Alteromonas sediminis]RPJ68238.1 EAL domain-containing protein [Alteromonas sediminis]
MSQQSRPAPISETQTLRQMIELLYQSAGTAIVLTFVAVSVVTFLISTEVTNTLKYDLWAAMVVTLAIRSFDLVYWAFTVRDTDFEPSLTYYRYAAGVVLTAVVWSAYVVLLYDDFDILSLSACIIVTCAMTTGASSILAPSRKLSITYCTLVLLPFCVIALQDSRMHYFSLGAIGLAYWFALISLALKSNRFVNETIVLRNENQQLKELAKHAHEEASSVKEELQRSNEALDHANASLEIEVNKRTDDIHRLSNRDPLTGLMNRNGFMRLLNKQITASKRMNNKFAILFVDLDGFKQVNDSLGHQVGDRVLEEVASRLARYSEEDNLARWGGDEFVMLLPYANDDTAMAVANATRSSIALSIDVESYNISLDATIGISLFPDHADDAQGMIQLADLTMYEQKKRKPGSYAVYSQEYYDALQEELMLRDGLRNAIANNELSLCYQPIIEAEGDAIWSVEALLRWNFDGKPVSPAVFIPLAEKSGLISDIGNWVLHRACIDAAQWQFTRASVSVNVSVIQLMDDSFISSLDKVLLSSGLAPERLHIEITESVFADNQEKVLAQINAVKQRNIQISIDDFGTGFSSLSQLQSLSFDHIKIDRAFVQNLEEGSDTIIRATVFIAKEFRCKTVAEGIETQAHAERLKSMGVDCLQGYLFAKPMTNNALPEWCKQFAKRTKN